MACCKGLNYADCPDYAYLKSLFRELLARERLECDLEWDWRVLGAGSRESGGWQLFTEGEETGELDAARELRG